MSDKLKQGRDISLPFAEFGKGTLWHVKFNPFVSGYACVIIWFFIVYSICARWQAAKEWALWFQWVTDEWTWLYVGSQNIWIAVLGYLACTKFGSIKFGGPDAVPEFHMSSGSPCSTAAASPWASSTTPSRSPCGTSTATPRPASATSTTTSARTTR
jgi:hypothetical protein